jgi:AcrR family transcriptional regulator
MARPPTDLRPRVLDAALSVLLHRGAHAVTLDAVAREAGVSKGGLLYQFPGRAALLEGMVRDVIARFDGAVAEAMAADPQPVGRFLRAYLRVVMAESERSAARALLAAVAAEPALSEVVREGYAGWFARAAEDGLPADRARLVLAAADGLWVQRAFETDATDTGWVDGLIALTRGGAP